MTILRTITTTFMGLLPSWLRDGDELDDPDLVSDGAKNHRTLFQMIDASAERARQGLYARFPSYAPDDALELLGRDRGLLRGRNESAATYAARLLRWRVPRGHRVRGNAFALLEQISIYFGLLRVLAIDVKGTRHTRTQTPGGTVTEAVDYALAWDWDGAGSAPAWARFWTFLDARTNNGIQPAPDFDDPALWGGALGVDGYCVGVVGLTPLDFAAARKIVRGSGPYPAWKPAGTRAEWLIVILDGEPVDDVAPDGTWLHWSKDDGGTRVASRYEGWRYVSLTPAANNTYPGDPDSTSTSVTLPDGTIYTGDPDAATFGAVTLPDGTLYTGDADAATFGAVRLIDDGDAPA